MSVLEAMSHGLTVTITEVGPQLEVIDHNVSGVLVPPEPGARERFLQRSYVRAYATLKTFIGLTSPDDPPC
jgi:hypothetical protein